MIQEEPIRCGPNSADKGGRPFSERDTMSLGSESPVERRWRWRRRMAGERRNPGCRDERDNMSNLMVETREGRPNITVPAYMAVPLAEYLENNGLACDLEFKKDERGKLKAGVVKLAEGANVAAV